MLPPALRLRAVFQRDFQEAYLKALLGYSKQGTEKRLPLFALQAEALHQAFPPFPAKSCWAAACIPTVLTMKQKLQGQHHLRTTSHLISQPWSCRCNIEPMGPPAKFSAWDKGSQTLSMCSGSDG